MEMNKQKRNWAEISGSDNHRLCFCCGNLTPNNFLEVIIKGSSGHVIICYFCDDTCVEVYKQAVQKW
jgi:hypothetical protein